MSNRITFLNDHWYWPVIVGVLILLCVFVWKELVLSKKRLLLLRITLSIFAIAALALIALKPALPTSETADNVLLLTPGYGEAQVDSLKREHRTLKVLDYSLEPVNVNDIGKAEVIYVLGNGLPHYDLRLLDDLPAIYVRGKTPEGIVKIKFPEKIAEGESLEITGLYSKPTEGHKLVLQDPGGTALDSLDLKDEVEQRFRLTTVVKAVGDYEYYLTEKGPGDEVLTRDPVPIQVMEKQGLRILILNNFPTFETKYLKNFLAEAGHELVVRSQLTRGRHKYEYFNTGRTVIGSLSRETLESYDLLIMDAPTLRNIGSGQSRAIDNSVREDGLGVFIQPDEAFFNSPGTLVDLEFERRGRLRIESEEWPEVDLSPFPFSIRSSPGLESTYVGGSTQIAGYQRKGQGRIGTTILSNTWQLVLEGNDKAYREIWSQMIAPVSKREDPLTQLETQAQFSFPNEPYQVKIKSSIDYPVITNRDGRILALARDVKISEQWKATIWPRESGWHKLHEDTAAVFNFYVAEEGSWNALTAQNTIEKNSLYFDRPLTTGQLHTPVKPVNPLGLYIIFLVCMGGLWLEPKLS